MVGPAPPVPALGRSEAGQWQVSVVVPMADRDETSKNGLGH